MTDEQAGRDRGSWRSTSGSIYASAESDIIPSGTVKKPGMAKRGEAEGMDCGGVTGRRKGKSCEGQADSEPVQKMRSRVLLSGAEEQGSRRSRQSDSCLITRSADTDRPGCHSGCQSARPHAHCTPCKSSQAAAIGLSFSWCILS